jgi:putative FmdB family regulatory protein
MHELLHGRIRVVKRKIGGGAACLQMIPLMIRILKTTEQEGPMPTYEFNCEKCGNQFSVIMGVWEYDKEMARMRCPKCKSKRVKQVLSTFVAKTTNKS